MTDSKNATNPTMATVCLNVYCFITLLLTCFVSSLISQKCYLVRSPTTQAHRSNQCEHLPLAYHGSLPKFLSLVCQQDATHSLVIRHNTVFTIQTIVLFSSIKLLFNYNFTQNPINNFEIVSNPTP